MRNYVLVYINGRRVEVAGPDVFGSLSDLLRREQGLVGTKIVCEEGDCGSCTVLIGRLDGKKLRYQSVDSCIQFMCQLDCCHIVTVEGLKMNGTLHPVQQAMVDYHGSQCGFCTPGFVMSMAVMFETKDRLSDQDLRCGLTGNLCRCTGYVPIIEAGMMLDGARMSRLDGLYPPQAMIDEFEAHGREPVCVEADCAAPGLGPDVRTYFKPVDVEGAVAFKKDHPDVKIIAGGTDVGVQINKRVIDPKVIMSLCSLPGLCGLTYKDDTLVTGAMASWAEIEEYIRDIVPQFHKILAVFASAQIKNVATIGGNIANASPIADSLPFLYVMNAEVELTGVKGTRRVNINNFYKGYKVLAMKPDELITRVHIPLPQPDETLRLYKVSKRRDLDISTFTAGILMRRDGDTIDWARIAYGGVGPNIIRTSKTERFLAGKPFNEETLRKAGRIARTEITPITAVRAGKDYRCQLAENILVKFYYDCCEPAEALAAL